MIEYNIISKEEALQLYPHFIDQWNNGHPIYLDEHNVLRYVPDMSIREAVRNKQIDLNKLHNERVSGNITNEQCMDIYRKMGCSLGMFWEVFEFNEEIRKMIKFI